MSDVALGAVVGMLFLALFINLVLMSERIGNLNHRVSCLEHPFGASSAAVARVKGRIVVVQHPYATGC